jgi:hypothetical protein
MRGETRYLEWNGERRPMAEWAERLGLNYNTLATRLGKLGWTVDEALSNQRGTQLRERVVPYGARMPGGEAVFLHKPRKVWGMSPERAAIIGLIDADEYLDRYK